MIELKAESTLLHIKFTLFNNMLTNGLSSLVRVDWFTSKSAASLRAQGERTLPFSLIQLKDDGLLWKVLSFSRSEAA
jgi:hypothetical protein